MPPPRLAELTRAEKDGETEVTRQRAEAPYALDVQIRRTIAHLRRIGELEKPVIAFTSDNGYYLGEHRKRTGKVTLHEPSLRVPLVMAGTTTGGADGTSILPMISGGGRGWSRPVVAGEVELYDLLTDPLELENLARSPKHAESLRELKDLYAHYHDCRGAECRVPLPTRWQLSAAQARRLTRHQVRATNAYYGN